MTSLYLLVYNIGMKHLTLRERQLIRTQAAKLFSEGYSNAEIGRVLGASRQSVSGWYQIWKKQGAQGLTYETPGPKSRLTKEQLEEIAQELLKGPEAHGYDTQLWTLARIADLIEKVTGVEYHPNYVWHILKQMDWSCQKPELYPRQRNEDTISRWKYQTWPRIKKGHRSKKPL